MIRNINEPEDGEEPIELPHYSHISIHSYRTLKYLFTIIYYFNNWTLFKKRNTIKPTIITNKL